MKHFFKSFTTVSYTTASLTLLLFLQSCSEPADKFFDIAILNTNTINDFGTPTLAKHINDETIEFADISSSKKKGDEAGKLVQNNILFMEKSLKDIKALSATDDSRKSIREQSIAIYEFVIPVYKNEYLAYAKLCDSKAPQQEKDKILKSIEQKYSATFESKYTALLASGKVFAEQNHINVDFK